MAALGLEAALGIPDPDAAEDATETEQNSVDLAEFWHHLARVQLRARDISLTAH